MLDTEFKFFTLNTINSINFLLISNKKIYLSSKSYNDLNTYKEIERTQKHKGFFSTIDYAEFISMSANPKEELELLVKTMDTNNKVKSSHWYFNNEREMLEAAQIISANFNLKIYQESENRKSILMGNSIIFLLCCGISWMIYTFSRDDFDGAGDSAKTRALTFAIKKLALFIGDFSIILICILFIIYPAYLYVGRYLKPGKIAVWKKTKSTTL